MLVEEIIDIFLNKTSTLWSKIMVTRVWRFCDDSNHHHQVTMWISNGDMDFQMTQFSQVPVASPLSWIEYTGFSNETLFIIVVRLKGFRGWGLYIVSWPWIWIGGWDSSTLPPECHLVKACQLLHDKKLRKNNQHVTIYSFSKVTWVFKFGHFPAVCPVLPVCTLCIVHG